MAGKNYGPSFETIMRDLQARKFSPIYILMGEEPYYIDKISDFVAENALDETERDFNQTIIFGADTTAAQVADMARRYPMMAERQVVIVKEAQNLRSMEALAKYAEKLHGKTLMEDLKLAGLYDNEQIGIEGRGLVSNFKQKDGTEGFVNFIGPDGSFIEDYRIQTNEFTLDLDIIGDSYSFTYQYMLHFK